MFSGSHVQYFYLRQKKIQMMFLFQKEFLAPHWIPILPEDFPLQPAGDGGGSWTRGHFISGSCKLFIAQLDEPFYIDMKKCLIHIPDSFSF
jgi:hypothetical protein